MTTITPTHHEKLEWARFAQAAYHADVNILGHRFSAAASFSSNTPMPVDRFHALQDIYRNWLVFGMDVALFEAELHGQIPCRQCNGSGWVEMVETFGEGALPARCGHCEPEDAEV